MNNIYNAAEQARKNYENSLGYLITDLQTAQKADQDLLKSQYDELLTTINTNEQTLRNNYEQSAREAYVNKMMTERGLGEKLNQLGIDTQGTGINEYYNVGVDYGKNYAALQSALNAGLLDLDTERAGALSDYNAGLASLNKDYSGKLADLKLSISDRGQRVYNDYVNNQLAWLDYVASKNSNPIILGGDDTEPKEEDNGAYITEADYLAGQGNDAAAALGYKNTGKTAYGQPIYSKGGAYYMYTKTNGGRMLTKLDDNALKHLGLPYNGATTPHTSSSNSTDNLLLKNQQGGWINQTSSTQTKGTTSTNYKVSTSSAYDAALKLQNGSSSTASLNQLKTYFKERNTSISNTTAVKKLLNSQVLTSNERKQLVDYLKNA